MATNAGWGSGSIQFGGEETANEANAMKAGLDKVLRSKRKELHALREQDPAGEFNNRRRRENEVKKEEAEKRREEFRRRKMEDDFNSETDPEKKIANRRQLIEEEKTKQAELQKSIDGVKAEVDARTEANDVPGRNEAERRLLALQEKMDGSQETVHGLEQQISSVQGGGGMPGGSAPVSPAADSGVMGNPRGTGIGASRSRFSRISGECGRTEAAGGKGVDVRQDHERRIFRRTPECLRAGRGCTDGSGRKTTGGDQEPDPAFGKHRGEKRRILKTGTGSSNAAGNRLR